MMDNSAMENTTEKELLYCQIERIIQEPLDQDYIMEKVL